MQQDVHARAGELHTGAARQDRDERSGNRGLQQHHHSSGDEAVVKERFLYQDRYPQNTFGTSSHVQDQFPGQDTLLPVVDSTSTAQVPVTSYYAGDTAYVYDTSASLPVNQFPQMGVGAAAEYYSQAPMQSLETGGSNVQSHASQEQKHRPTRPTLISYDNHHDSQSLPPQHYPTPLHGQVSGYGKQGSGNSSVPYATVAAGVAIGAHDRHHYQTHQHNHSAPIGTTYEPQMYNQVPPRPYTSGSTAMQHKHKGPISKFVDWWKDYDEVRKMEEYSEFIGVCKYCFDPRSSVSEAPRPHGSRRSFDSLRRRSGDSLRRSYIKGPNNSSRVDKESRYHSSSDSERRRKKTGSWLGAGIAAYGLSKVGNSIWKSSRDLDDTYSFKSGRMSAGNDRHRQDKKNQASHREVRAERGNGHQSRFEGSRYREEHIHVHHPSPSHEHTPQYSTIRRKRSSLSRSQSPSLGQILGLTSSQKWKSATTSRASSPSRTSTGFFSRKPIKSQVTNKKAKGFFNFGNSSSSSANSDLAFGHNAVTNNKKINNVGRKGSDDHLKATLLGIGATAAALSAMQSGNSRSRKPEPRGLRNGRNRINCVEMKNTTSDEEEWESADESDSVSSALAFGEFDIKGKKPRRQPSSDSMTSQSSGTDKWSWRWRKASDKKKRSTDMSQDYYNESPSDRTTSSQPPLRYVQPAPIVSPVASDANWPASMPGAFPEQPSGYALESGTMQIQQPQPLMPLHPSMFRSTTSPQPSHVGSTESRTSARPQLPMDIRRTQSSPVSSHTMRNAAIVGLAGAATAGILTSGKARNVRDDSPSNVRFELTAKQAKKEESQKRKEDARGSKDRAKKDSRESKERARLDRGRAMQEESVRQAVDENAKREAAASERQKQLVEDTKRHQVWFREKAAEESRVQEAERQRQKEIEEFMQNALAEQAREAEREEQHEAWLAQQTSRQEPHETVNDKRYNYRDGYVEDVANMPYTTRSYEPSNEHSGQHIMDDDEMDPEFLTRRRSRSDLARHHELARKAAARIVSDLEERYNSPTLSQAEFFAPKELLESSKGKSKAYEPIEDNDYQVYHMPEAQMTSMLNGPPPPYQAPYEYANLRTGKMAWDIPKLNVIAPTPPTSHAGSANDEKASVGPSTHEHKSEVESQKSSKVSWGEDQTRVFEISSPDSSQEHVVLSDELPRGLFGPDNEYIHTEIFRAAESAMAERVSEESPSRDDQLDDFIEEIPRDAAPSVSSNRFYRQPFVESVSDVAFTLDSPGTEGAPPVRGYVEGEVEYQSGSDDDMPHIPGGFDDPVSDLPDRDHVTSVAPHQREDGLNDDTQYSDYEKTREPSKPRESEPNQAFRSLETVEQDQDDYFMSNKERRKQERAAKKASTEREKQSISNDYNKHNTRERSSENIGTAAAVGAAAVGALVSEVYQSRRKSEPEDFDHHRPGSAHSEPRNTQSKSTPTSPVYERRPSLPGHAFDDLDILSGDKKTRKVKRNSLFNTPTIGSPLRSAMTWDEYIEPMSVTDHADTANIQSDEAPKDVEQGLSRSVEDATAPQDIDFPSPKSEHGAASIVSAPVGDEHAGRRRKSSKSHRERDHSTSPRRSASVAVSEPYESSRKQKPRSHRESREIDDASSVASTRSRSSHSSKKEDEESRSKKKGGILSLFRRKTIDDVSSEEPRRSKGESEESRHHHRRRSRSSEYLDESRSKERRSVSRSRGHDDESHSRNSSGSRHSNRHDSDASIDDASSRISDSKHRRKHRTKEESQSPEDDTISQTSESKRKHRHRHDSDDKRSISRDSRSRRDQKDDQDQEQSFLAERVEDEGSMPLPANGPLPSSRTPEVTDQSGVVTSVPDLDELPEATECPASQPLDVELEGTESPVTRDEAELSVHPGADDRSVLSPPELLAPITDVALAESIDLGSTESPTTRDSAEILDARAENDRSVSPTVDLTPARPTVPLRISSSTAVPLRFRYPSTSPGVPRERSSSFGSHTAPSPISPTTPKAKRPSSSEFTRSTEFRPLYLLERTRKPQTQEIEKGLPSLPPSRSTSASSLQSNEDWQSAAEDLEVNEHQDHDPSLSSRSPTEESNEAFGSTQTTPKAVEFPQHVLGSHHTHAEPEYYSWSDMEREERLRRESEDGLTDLQAGERPSSDDHQIEMNTIDEHYRPDSSGEVITNADPLATDIWGDLSDNDQQGDTVVKLEPVEKSEMYESRTTPVKKRKGKTPAKLGTSSTSGNSDPVRETPAELERRREQDAQDAVDTWFKSPVTPAPQDAVDASNIPLPAPTTPLDDEAEELEMRSTSVEDPEPTKLETEPASPLLSRKKSKKGKKKQKSATANERSLASPSTEDTLEVQTVVEPTLASPSTEKTPEAQKNVRSEPHEDLPLSTEDRDPPEGHPTVASHEQESFAESQEIDAVTDPINDFPDVPNPEQVFQEARPEGTDTPLSKADRKKKNKKARKSTLSIAVPAVLASLTTLKDAVTGKPDLNGNSEAEQTTAELEVEAQRSTESMEDMTSSVPALLEDGSREKSSSDEVAEERNVSTDVLVLSGPATVEHHHASLELNSASQEEIPMPGKETLILEGSSSEPRPEQIALPDTVDGELDEPEVVVSPAPPSSEGLPVTGSERESEQVIRADTDTMSISVLPVSEQTTVSKRSSWFSWLPGGKTHDADIAKDETSPEVQIKESTLSQEQFERLLEQPLHRSEYGDKPAVLDRNISKDSDESLQEMGAGGLTIDGGVSRHGNDEMKTTTAFLPTLEPQPSENAMAESENTNSQFGRNHDTREKIETTVLDDALFREATNKPLSITTPEEDESLLQPDSATQEEAKDSPEILLGPTQEENIILPSVPDPEAESAGEFWSTSKKGKKGKKGKKAKKEIVEPLPIPEVRASEHRVATEEFELLVNAEDQISETGLVTIDQESAPGYSIDESVSVLTPVAQVEASAEHDPHKTTIELDEQSALNAPAHIAGPSSESAQDEWAMPISRKRNKKGKKGKQSVPEPLEQIEDASVEEQEALTLPSIGEPLKMEDVNVAPEVFETPAEGTAEQYFETPAEKLSGQYFMTPSEERPEQGLTVPMDVTPSSLPVDEEIRNSSESQQPASRSVTPTHEEGQHVISDETENIPSQQRFKDVDTKTENQTQETSNALEATNFPDIEISSERQSSQEENSELTPKHDALEIEHDATEQPVPQVAAESDTFFEAFSSKKSKKDKKKAKKTKQREAESELFQDEAAEPNIPTELDQPSEPVIDSESRVTQEANVDAALMSTPPPESVEEQFIVKELSKKEKRKAKKAAKGDFGSPIEGTRGQQSQVLPEDSSYFLETSARDRPPASEELEAPVASIAVVAMESLSPPSDVAQESEQALVQSPRNETSPDQPSDLSPGTDPGATVDVGHNTETEDMPKRTTLDNGTSHQEQLSQAEHRASNSPVLDQAETSSSDDRANVLPVDSHDDPGIGRLPEQCTLEDVQTSERDIESRIHDPEAAVVDDQAPSVLDQVLLLVDEGIDEDTIEPNDKQRASEDALTATARDGPRLSNEEPVSLESTRESRPMEDAGSIEDADPIEHIATIENLEPGSLTSSKNRQSGVRGENNSSDPLTQCVEISHPLSDVQRIEQFVIDEPPPADVDMEMPTEDPVLLTEAAAASDFEPAPTKMSKKDKRKAKKIKSTLEYTDVEDIEAPSSSAPEVEVSAQPMEEDLLEAADCETTVADTDPVDNDVEIFTSKLSKKDRKKAKKLKSKGGVFTPEPEQQVTTYDQPQDETLAEERSMGTSPSRKLEFEDRSDRTSLEDSKGMMPSSDKIVAEMSASPKDSDQSGVAQTDIVEDAQPDKKYVDGLPLTKTVGSADALGDDFPSETRNECTVAADATPTLQSVDVWSAELKPHDIPEDIEQTDVDILPDHKIQPNTEILGETHTASRPDSGERLSEVPPLEDIEFVATTSKKNKKKGKKARSGVDDSSTMHDITDHPSEPIDESNVMGPDDTTQGAVEVKDTKIDPDDEWALPTKQSKKEKRKTKKSKNVEESLPEELLPGEAEETVTQPTDRNDPSEVSSEAPGSVPDPEADAWAFSRKPSKKEKRKAKKNVVLDEQQGSTPTSNNESDGKYPYEAPRSTSDIDTELAASESKHKVTQNVKDLPSAFLDDRGGAVPPDIDFAATLAAGLQDSGFDPNLVIEDPVFHRRASPTSVAEADPGEATSTTSRRHRSGIEAGSPTLAIAEPSEPIISTADDGFSEALTAGLIASGFALDSLASISTGDKELYEEPEEISFAAPKRKKKNRKGKQAELESLDEPTSASVPVMIDEKDAVTKRHDETPTAGPEDTLPEPKIVQIYGGAQGVDDKVSPAAETLDRSTEKSPKKSANLLQISKDSQALPIPVDEPTESEKKRVDQVVGQSADTSPIETASRDIALSISNKTPPQPAAKVYSEPPAWSFDNLQSPVVQQAPKLDEEKVVLQAVVDPVSPVESTTKDRTSYLFQSPLNMGLDNSETVTSRDIDEVPRKETEEPTGLLEPDSAYPKIEAAALPSSLMEQEQAPMSPTPSRISAPSAHFPPSPSTMTSREPAIPSSHPALYLADQHPEQSPPLTRKKSIYDLGSPDPGRSIKSARRTATPQQPFREHTSSSNQLDVSQYVDGVSLEDQVPNLRPLSSQSTHSTRNNNQQFRPPSSASNHSAVPSLRRINRSISGDLRAASRRINSTHGPTTIPIEPPPTPPLQEEEFNGHGASRALDMANVFVSDCF
jgi:hypothetical protein